MNLQFGLPVGRIVFGPVGSGLDVRRIVLAPITDALTPEGEKLRATIPASLKEAQAAEEERLRLYMLGHLGPQKEQPATIDPREGLQGYTYETPLADVVRDYGGPCGCDLCQRGYAGDDKPESFETIRDRINAAIYGDNGNGREPPEGEPYGDRPFQRGDVVQLNSGGYDMTVTAVKGDQVDLIWQTDAGPIYRDTIATDLLVFSDLITTLH